MVAHRVQQSREAANDGQFGRVPLEIAEQRRFVMKEPMTAALVYSQSQARAAN